MILHQPGSQMFQLDSSNHRQHQTLAFNSLIMNNIFNLANCFNQFGKFNLRSGFRNHPFFLCVLLLSVFMQVCLTELNAFGLENLNPLQWFVCFVFALLSALIAPLTGQQQRQRIQKQQEQQQRNHHQANKYYQQQQQQFQNKRAKNLSGIGSRAAPTTPKAKSSSKHQFGKKSQASFEGG